MFVVRDADGYVYKELKTPTVIYDREFFQLLCIGDSEKMEDSFYKLKKYYIDKGKQKTANDICLLELPKKQEIIDKVWQSDGAYLSQITQKDYE
jgi:hypothetical protein